MAKSESKLKELGWKIETFQPKGEKYPWSLKISKAIQTRGLHSDIVTDKIREARGKYVITAYLDPNTKVDTKTREARIMSALKWELTKNYKLLEKYTWLKELEKVCGKVKPLIFHKAKRKAVLKTENEKALEESKKPKVSENQKTTEIEKIEKEKPKKASSKKSLANAPESPKITVKKQAKVTDQKTKVVKKANASKKAVVAKSKTAKKQTSAKVSGVSAKKKSTVKKVTTKTIVKKSAEKINKTTKRKTKGNRKCY